MAERKSRRLPSPVLAGLTPEPPPRVGEPTVDLPEIERGVPIQERVYSGRRTPYRRLIETMEPGDSILVPEAEAQRYINPARHMVYRHGWSIVTRRDGRGSVRIWRRS